MSVQSDPQAGAPSRRVVPSRTLAGPSRLSVALRSSPDDPELAEEDHDIDTLRQSLLQRAKIKKRGERWSDKLMEEAVDLVTFKRALPYLTPQQYRDILHERHLNGLCSYPTCSNPPAAEYSVNRRFKISTTKRTIREKEGNEEEGFCGRKCRVKSDWVMGKLEETSVLNRAGKDCFDLLEDMEVPPTLQASTTPQIGSRQHPSLSQADRSGTAALSVSEQDARGVKKAPDRREPILPPALGSTAPSNVADIISNLTIHERPTPTATGATDSEPVASRPPTAPSPAGSTSTTPTPLPAPTTAPTAPAGPPSRRHASSSLVSAPTTLTSTVLSASKQMGPVPQLAPDSEDEVEEGDWGEGEMGLEWGEETEEMKALFEEARVARALLDNSGEGAE